MKRLLCIICLALLAGPAQAANMIYQKPLLPAPTDAARLYIYDPVSNSDRNITWGDIKEGVLEVRQQADEPDNLPKVRVYDKTGRLRLTIFADGALEIQ